MRATVAFLYDTRKKPLPAYPAPGEEWPTFPSSADGSPGARCCRFDFSKAVSHDRNQKMVNEVVGWLTTNRDNWPVNTATALLARDATSTTFRESTEKYFGSLRREAVKQEKSGAGEGPSAGQSTSPDHSKPALRSRRIT